MANAVRPPLRAAPERPTRLTLSPGALDDAHTTISTRRTSRSGPLLELDNDEKPVTRLNSSPPKPGLPARTTSKKRPAAALSPDATDPRPPTKITVTQPHGELLRITNGVAAPLGIDADAVPSTTPTPRPSSSAGKQPGPASTTSQDKRSLRSHDGGSRLKSDLAIYFFNYDDVIAGVPQPPGVFHPALQLAHV